MNSVNLDELAAGRLPQHIIDALKEMELTVEEVVQWQDSKPNVRVFTTSDGKLLIETRVQIPLKKTVTIISIVAPILWGIASFTLQHIDVLQTFFQ